MIILNYKVNANKLTLEKKEFITTGSINQVENRFEFLDGDWNELEKTAIFKINNVVTKTKLENNKCFIPPEALQNDGELHIGVFGIKTNNGVLEKRSTTGLIKLNIYEGSFV